MKTTLALLATLTVASVAHADFSFEVPVGQLVPDGDAAGLASTFNVTGQDWRIGDLTVSLNISGSYNGDLYAYLTHDSGFSVLLNRVGVLGTDTLGYADNGLNVTFSDSGSDIHFYRDTTGALGGPLTGTWAPDGRNASPDTLTGTETPDAFLASFVNTPANGQWTLFVADVSGGDSHQLVNWGVAMVPVPEPATWGLLSGLALLGAAALRRLRANP